jgi:ribosomal protein S18 acetylase RimI-like enzyme
MTTTISRAVDPQDIAAVKSLFQAYAESLEFSLCFQNFEAEMADFPGRYGAADGALLLAKVHGEPAGAVGLWSLGDGICEMKRLYVYPRFQGLGLGRRLTQAVIDEGRRLGYGRMRLDTVSGQMQAAVALYRALGFQEIAPYTHNPLDGVIYMELAL